MLPAPNSNCTRTRLKGERQAQMIVANSNICERTKYNSSNADDIVEAGMDADNDNELITANKEKLSLIRRTVTPDYLLAVRKEKWTMWQYICISLVLQVEHMKFVVI